MSYPLKNGIEIGSLLKTHEADFEIDESAFGDGVFDRADNSVESVLSFDKLQKIINLQVTNDENNTGTPFSRYKNKMFDLTEDGKILKYIVKRGVGPTMHEDCVAFIRYRGFFEYQEVPFDSTMTQNGTDRAVPFDLVEAGLIPGLRLALLSMRKGEEAEFLVHPDLAYGKLGCPPRIPGDATVLFIIQVEKFVDRTCISVVSEELDIYERNRFGNVFKKAEDQFLKGNEEFFKNNTFSASNLYRQAIKLLLSSRLADEKEERFYQTFLVKIYSNLCECHYKEKNYKKVCAVVADAVRDCHHEAYKTYKLMYLLGCANMMLGNFQQARNRLAHAGRLCPGSKEVSSALEEVRKRETRYLNNEKIMATNKFQVKEKPPEAESKEQLGKEK